MDAFNIEIVSIGNELCYGKVADTNAFWLADRVTSIGGMVSRISCVRDDEEEICKVLGESLNRKPRFVLVTGGLGPTKDDLTIDALSRLTHSKIVTDELTLEKVSERKGIPIEKLPQHFFRMARTVSDAETFVNPLGISPGIVFRMGETTLVVMPGPPKEVQAIFEKYVAGIIGKETSCRSCSRRVVVDMVESEVSPLIEEVEKELVDVYLKPLVSEYVPGAGLPVELVAFGEDEEACSRLAEEAILCLKRLVETKGREIVTST